MHCHLKPPVSPTVALITRPNNQRTRAELLKIRRCLKILFSVVSLGWLTPGAATEGITPLFFPEKPGDFFSVATSAVSPLISSSQKLTTYFCSSRLYRFLLLSLGCHPLEGVIPHLFYLSDLVSPLFFVNLPTKMFSFGCHPPGG